MQVKTQTRNKTLQQVKRHRHFFAARALAKQFNDHQPLPLEVYRAICSGEFRLI